MKLKLLVVREANGEKISSPHDVVRLMRQEGRADRECFWILHLAARHQVIEKELISVGTLSSALVHPREVFKKSVTNGSACLITVHNHPSGDRMPSSEDIEIWERLNKAGEIIGIKVLDHMIITPSGSFYSSNGDSPIWEKRKDDGKDTHD